MATPQYNKDSISLELFIVSIGENDLVQYIRRETAKDHRHPDQIVHSLLQSMNGGASDQLLAPVIMHSTSWRHENNGSIVLTYLAYIEHHDLAAVDTESVKNIQWSKLPPTEELNLLAPSPSSIQEEDVLAHGLRHLAFLARRDESGKFSQILNKRSKDFFWSIAPAISGQLN